MALAAGTNLGAYRIVEQVGQGGMATVYKAFQASLQRFVAIKVLPEFLAGDPGFRTRFEHEAVAIARLRHPNILTVYEHGEQDGIAYIVTEFVDGGTLADQLGRPLPIDYAVQILAPIASALDYAHARGVLHRDLKPSNILIGHDGTPILSDFGLALMMTTTQARLTQTGMILGTPEYMAPEQCSGGDVTAMADEYSLGVVAYEMLTGRVPFSAATPASVLVAQIQNELPPPRNVNPQLPATAESALLKALAKAPEDRFRSSSDFARALTAGADTVVGAPPARRPIAAIRKPSARNNLALIAAALVVLIALVGGGMLLKLTPSRSGNSAAVTPTPSPVPTLSPSPSPLATGPLVFQAKLDGSSSDVTNVYQLQDQSASRISFPPGAIELAITKPNGNIGFGVNFNQLARYVTELDFSIQPGSSLNFWWTVRTGNVQNICNHNLEVDAARELMHLMCFQATPDNSPGPPATVLGRDVPLQGLQTGKTFSVVAVVDPPRYQIYLGQSLVIDVIDQPHTDLALTAFACFGEGGSVRISAIRIYTMPS